MLELQNITWSTPGGARVLEDVSLTVKSGGLTVITGPNGGGKTTLAKLIAGTEPPESGRILLDGEDITPLNVTQRARQGVCFAFQQPVRFKGLTVGRLLELAAGRPLGEEQACALLSRVGLCGPEYISRQADASLSGGEMKRVEIATVLARPGRLFLFDEPEAGIDLWSFSGLTAAFRALRDQRDRALLLISHQERILEIADEIIVLSGGKIARQGPAARVLPQLMEKSEGCAACGKRKAVFA